jgi:hypothetical protein
LAIAVDTQNREVIKLILSYKPRIDNGKEIVAMAEPYEDAEIIKMIKNYFGFQLILYDPIH